MSESPDPSLKQTGESTPEHLATYRLGHVRLSASALTHEDGSKTLGYMVMFARRPDVPGNHVLLEDLVHLRSVIDHAITDGMELMTERAMPLKESKPEVE